MNCHLLKWSQYGVTLAIWVLIINLAQADHSTRFTVLNVSNNTIIPNTIPVLVMEYYPDEDKDGRLDEIAGDAKYRPVQEQKDYVANLTTELVKNLEEASRYHGYSDPMAPALLDYQIIDRKVYDKPIPRSTQFPPFADHFAILQGQVDICSYVEQQGVKEVWIWMYHYDAPGTDNDVVPIESNMAGPNGDISNSFRSPDLPVCNSTYTVYNYNYGRGMSEALENHTHQIEHVLNWVDGRDNTPPDQWDKLLFWGKWVGSDYTHKIVNPGCGWTHYPPNGTHDYDWQNSNAVLSNCQDWYPDGSGRQDLISCEIWGCDNNAGVTFKIWWLQNLPGYNHGLTYQGKALRNWWEFIADFDMALAQGKSLVTDVELSVKLTYFNANYNDNEVSFEWKSGVEIDSVGFNLWCANRDSLNKPFKVNQVIIPSSEATSFDETYYNKKYSRKNSGLNNLESQYCVIEEVNNNGSCHIHCNFLTMMSINGNKYLQNNDDSGLSKVKSFCNAQKAGICLDKLLH